MAGPAAAAGLIFTGGRVHTVNASDDVVSALAVAGGRILAVGSDADALAYRGPGTEVVELRGRSLLPGFIDAHCHFPSLGLSMSAIDCKAPGMQSIEALQKAVRERAATQPAGTWIRGRGYDQSRLAERRHPNRLDWDAVAPEHPVIFTRTCGHIASVSGRALERAGLGDGTPDPPGGRHDRVDGRLLGVAYETAQTPLQMAALPTEAEYREGLLRADEAYLAAGATSVHDAGGLVGPAFAPCQALVEARRLHVRLYAFATVNSRQHPLMGLLASGIRTGLGDARLKVGAFKVMTDGSSSGPTAATREPYHSDCNDSGILYWSQDDLDDLLGPGASRGLPVHGTRGGRSRHPPDPGRARPRAARGAPRGAAPSHRALRHLPRPISGPASARRASCPPCSRRSSGSSATAISATTGASAPTPCFRPGASSRPEFRWRAARTRR